jgi:maltooligosyltrehalose trehalohydrolase
MVRVWAPSAEIVRLESNGGSLVLARADSGWWMGKACLEHGQDCLFQVDRRGSLPDPRLPWQPYGVHHASRHVDHSKFDWADIGWQPPPLSSGIIYEVHVGTYQRGHF